MGSRVRGALRRIRPAGIVSRNGKETVKALVPDCRYTGSTTNWFPFYVVAARIMHIRAATVLSWLVHSLYPVRLRSFRVCLAHCFKRNETGSFGRETNRTGDY